MAYARFTALDGLRGLAALVVVTHHSLLISPRLASAYTGHPARLEGSAWWLTYTPLHLVWEGTSAVYVFFVLSGFVLALPFLGTHPAPWRAYYPKRLARLYLPVWGSVALATLLILAVPRHAQRGQSWWVRAHDTLLSASTLFNDLTLTDPRWNNSALWSLKYEVAFSLLLPVYLFLATKLRRLAVPLAVAAFVATGFGVARDDRWLTYLPMFAVGVLMATRRHGLLAVAQKIPQVVWAGLAALAVVLTTSRWLPFSPALTASTSLVGAALVVYLFLGWSPAVRLGNTRPVQALGLLSFSLYLVHEPIVVTMAFLRPEAPARLILLVAVPVSLVAAMVFYRLVESPAHRLAKALGRLCGDRREPVAVVERAPSTVS